MNAKEVFSRKPLDGIATMFICNECGEELSWAVKSFGSVNKIVVGLCSHCIDSRAEKISDTKHEEECDRCTDKRYQYDQGFEDGYNKREAEIENACAE